MKNISAKSIGSAVVAITTVLSNLKSIIELLSAYPTPIGYACTAVITFIVFYVAFQISLYIINSGAAVYLLCAFFLASIICTGVVVDRYYATNETTHGSIEDIAKINSDRYDNLTNEFNSIKEYVNNINNKVETLIVYVQKITEHEKSLEGKENNSSQIDSLKNDVLRLNDVVSKLQQKILKIQTTPVNQSSKDIQKTDQRPMSNNKDISNPQY